MRKHITASPQPHKELCRAICHMVVWKQVWPVNARSCPAWVSAPRVVFRIHNEGSKKIIDFQKRSLQTV